MYDEDEHVFLHKLVEVPDRNMCYIDTITHLFCHGFDPIQTRIKLSLEFTEDTDRSFVLPDY